MKIALGLLAAVVLSEGASVTPAELRDFLAGRVPRWQLPERWSFISEVPKTGVGKFAKTRIREAYAQGDYQVIIAGHTLDGRIGAVAAHETAIQPRMRARGKPEIAAESRTTTAGRG